MRRAVNKQHKLEQTKKLLLTSENGITVLELSKELDVDYVTAWRYIKELSAVETEEGSARYMLVPTPEDVEFALAVLRRATDNKQSA